MSKMDKRIRDAVKKLHKQPKMGLKKRDSDFLDALNTWNQPDPPEDPKAMAVIDRLYDQLDALKKENKSMKFALASIAGYLPGSEDLPDKDELTFIVRNIEAILKVK